MLFLKLGIFALLGPGLNRAMSPLRPEETEDLPRSWVRLDKIGWILHTVIPGSVFLIGFSLAIIISTYDHFFH